MPELPPLVADKLSVGPYNSCALQAGTLRCWGSNNGHQLGTPDTDFRSTPLPQARSGWTDVTVGEAHLCGLLAGGAPWCWGNNDEGQAGVTAPSVLQEPTAVAFPPTASRIAARHNFTCAIAADQTLWCWGSNEEGQLAQDDPFPGPGVDRKTPVQIGTDADWLGVDTAQGHACGLRAPGRLYCWGRNLAGELGLGDQAAGQLRTPQLVAGAEDWIDVRCGQNHCCGRRTPGSLWCWGQGGAGGLGTGDHNDRTTPVQIGNESDWTALSVESFHTCGLRGAGELFCWGRNYEGQLGLGDLEDRLVPTRVGDRSDWVEVKLGRFHGCARRQDHQVFCTGQNSYGQLGTGDVLSRDLFTLVRSEP